MSRNGVCILDAALEVRPPFHPDEAIDACAALLQALWRTKITGDKYAGEWPRARFSEQGIEFEQSARPKSDLYGDLLPLINAGRVELLDLPRLSAQLCGLERRTARSGKDRSTTPPAATTIWPMRSLAFWSASTSTADNRWSDSTTCLSPTARGHRRHTPAEALRDRFCGRHHGGRGRRGGLLRPRAVQAAALCPRRRGWAVVAGFLHRHGDKAQ